MSDSRTPQSEVTPLAGSGGPTRLIARESVIAKASEDALTSVRPLTAIVGESGVGRSSVLAAVRARLAGGRARIVELHALEMDRRTQYGALYRLLTDLCAPTESDTEASSARMSVLGLVAKLSANPEPASSPAVTAQLASAVHSVIRQSGPTIVLIDDAQWLDDGTASLTEALVRRFPGAGCSIVVTARTDWLPERDESTTTARTEAVRRLIDAGLAQRVTLRPLTVRESGKLIAEAINANPDPWLVSELHSASRGNPSALIAAIGAYRAVEALRVVDRNAYLVPAKDRPVLSERHPLLAPVRDSGADAWKVARAMAVLAPLGPSVPKLLATTIDMDEAAVHDALAALQRRRILVRHRDTDRGWWFRIPMVRAVLESCLGPYERRHFSAQAVNAIWDGQFEPADPHLLPDRLADAGKLVDPERATLELLARGSEILFTDGLHAIRWLRAAVDRATDSPSKAVALLAHSAACCIHNRMDEGKASAHTLLWNHADELAIDMVQEAEIIYLMSIVTCGDHDELLRIAERDQAPVPGGPAQHVVGKAFALVLLKRWEEARRIMAAHRGVWSEANVATADFGRIFESGVGVVQGDPSELYASIEDPARWRGQHLPQLRFEEARHEVDLLLSLGELGRATERMEYYDLDLSSLVDTDQFAVRYLRGQWGEAMETARRSMAAGMHLARPVGGTMMHWFAAQILCASGWLSRSRQIADAGRKGHLIYLFDFVEMQVLRVLGEHDEADDLLRKSLREAEDQGYALGTETMWAELARREVLLGRQDEARRSLDRLRRIADKMNTGRAAISHLVTRANVLGDHSSAEAAVALARERGQPYESALVFAQVARSGYRPTELLAEAYDLSSDLGALLLRAQLRKTMRKHNVPVPGRSATTSENERLLAVLVTEGLSNRQLATVFETTEKSVEGRLTRMFARIGYRSRVELAAAMLTGEYPG